MGRFSGSKWLAVVVSAVIGIALMYLLGYAFGSTMDYDTTLNEALGIVIGVAIASYFVTGFIAGAWMRETKSGMHAAILLLVVNFIISLTQGYIPNFLGIIIMILFAVICGSLGGWIGKLVKGKEKVDNNTDIEMVE